MAVIASATPATMVWYWPMCSVRSRNDTSRPSEANSSPAITAPAIRPIPATYAIASRLNDVWTENEADDTVPCSKASRDPPIPAMNDDRPKA